MGGNANTLGAEIPLRLKGDSAPMTPSVNGSVSLRGGTLG